jgi:hypothetical protein
MDKKKLKEAIFDMFRKSKETPKPQYKRIDSMLGGKMNLTADDFAQLDPNSDPYKLKAAFETAYLRGNTDSRASLKTLLDTAPYNEMKDMVDLIDNAKGTANTNPNRQFGASNQPTVRRSGGGLFEEKLRMQMLAGIITESQYKEKMEEVDSMGKIGKSYPAPGSEDSISDEETSPFNRPPSFKTEKWIEIWEPKFKIIKSIMDEYKKRGEDPIGSFYDFADDVRKKLGYKEHDDFQWFNPSKSGFRHHHIWAIDNVAFNPSRENLTPSQDIIYRGGPSNSWVLRSFEL